MAPHWSQDAYTQAYQFAAGYHNGQLVPGSDLPYVMHVTLVCMEVMAALRQELGHDEDLAIQCALLHDTIEDTSATYDDVRSAFGERVADGVLALTKDATLPKSQQMPDSLRRIRQQPHEVWMVKLADRTINLTPPFPPYWTSERLAAYRTEAQSMYEILKDSNAFLATRLLQGI